MRHLVDVVDFSQEELKNLLELGEDISRHPEKYGQVCKGKKIATLFFEPSTRTRLSFEAAMLELGGSVIGFSSANSSSAQKGEKVQDTVRVVANYADIIAMRHSIEGAALAAATVSTVPVINAGDGGHCHPTQTLADLLTIKKESGRLENLTVGLCGDLKYGRTVHSLLNALTRFSGNRFVLISPKELALPEYTVQKLTEAGVEVYESGSLDEFMPQLDVLYMTRVQKERFDSIFEYERVKNCFELTPDKLVSAKDTMRILHPLPRVNEISFDVDDDPRAAYFRQTLNGKIMRKALIVTLLSGGKELRDIGIKTDIVCPNKKCVTNVEGVAVREKEGRCVYCDASLHLK